MVRSGRSVRECGVVGSGLPGEGFPGEVTQTLRKVLAQHSPSQNLAHAQRKRTHNADGTLETLGRCLNISVAQGVGGTGTAVPGDHTTLWDCNGSGVEQWVQQSDGTWLNPPSGLCLDDPNFNTTNGWQLQVWTCNGGTNQIFNLQS
jgi:ricin-type beta-trefoil lectin protein